MGKDLYVLSYDHGGFVLWGEVIEARLDKVNHPFITAKTEVKKSVACDTTLAVCNDENNTVVVTDVSPAENGIEIRLCNYSDKPSKCSISVLGCNDYAETNLLGDIIEKITPQEFAVNPWEVKTFICK